MIGILVDSHLPPEFLLLIKERISSEITLNPWAIIQCYWVVTSLDKRNVNNSRYICAHFSFITSQNNLQCPIPKFETAESSLRKIFGDDLMTFEKLQPLTERDKQIYGMDKRFRIIIRDIDNTLSWSKIK